MYPGNQLNQASSVQYRGMTNLGFDLHDYPQLDTYAVKKYEGLFDKFVATYDLTTHDFNLIYYSVQMFLTHCLIRESSGRNRCHS
jgi:hypothetical protein